VARACHCVYMESCQPRLNRNKFNRNSAEQQVRRRAKLDYCTNRETSGSLRRDSLDHPSETHRTKLWRYEGGQIYGIPGDCRYRAKRGGAVVWEVDGFRWHYSSSRPDGCDFICHDVREAINALQYQPPTKAHESEYGEVDDAFRLRNGVDNSNVWNADGLSLEA
jgi:hypothetical protein